MYICVRIRVMSFSVLCFSLFFFFKQKTAYEMRISDWSSDVCSSDLLLTQLRASDFHVFTRLEVEQVCAAAGWTVRSDGAVVIPGTPSGGNIHDDGAQRVYLSIALAALEPEQFGHYLAAAVTTWGVPTWFSGRSDLDRKSTRLNSSH